MHIISANMNTDKRPVKNGSVDIEDEAKAGHVADPVSGTHVAVCAMAVGMIIVDARMVSRTRVVDVGCGFLLRLRRRDMICRGVTGARASDVFVIRNARLVYGVTCLSSLSCFCSCLISGLVSANLCFDDIGGAGVILSRGEDIRMAATIA